MTKIRSLTYAHFYIYQSWFYHVASVNVLFNSLENPALATDLRLPQSLEAGCTEEGVCWGALYHWGGPCMDLSSLPHTRTWPKGTGLATCVFRPALPGYFTGSGEPAQAGAGRFFYMELFGKDYEAHKYSLLILYLTYLLSQIPETEWKAMWFIQLLFSKNLIFANITKIYKHVWKGLILKLECHSLHNLFFILSSF